MKMLVFDSGIGGLGIAQELRRLQPRSNIAYLADGAGFPYGCKPEAALTERILRVIEAGLRAAEPDLVVVACNTASTVALAALRHRFPAIPFIGCVPPVRSAAEISRTRTIGLLATPTTLQRPYVTDLVARYAADCTVLCHGAPHLATLAEAKFRGDTVDLDVLRDEVEGLTRQPGGEHLDAVALGCTHYALLLPELRGTLPANTLWLDPAAAVARQACRVAISRASTVVTTTPECTITGPLQGNGRNVAFHTGHLPTGRAAIGWAEAGFTEMVGLRPTLPDTQGVI